MILYFAHQYQVIKVLWLTTCESYHNDVMLYYTVRPFLVALYSGHSPEREMWFSNEMI